MDKIKSVEEFREKIRVGNSRHAILVIGTGAVVMLALDFLLKVSLTNASLIQLAIFMFLVTAYLLARFLYAGQNKLLYIALYFYIHAITIAGFYTIIQLPSPLLGFLVVIALSVYMELGYRGMTLSILTFATGITGALYHQGIIASSTDFYRIIAYLFAITFIIYYSTIFLRIADEELVELDKSAIRNDFERSRLLTLVNNLNDAVISCDDELRIVLTNPKARHLLNIDRDPVDESMTSLVQIRDQDGQPISFPQLLNPDKKVVIYTNYRLHYTDKDFINIYIAINNVQVGKGNTESGYVILLRDITRQKSLEEERTEFISIMSHELRTPVSIVEGGISLAQSYADEESQDLRKFLDKAHDQTLMLAEIVNSLSTLVHSEKNKEKIAITEIEPRIILENLASSYQTEITKRNLELIVNIAEDLPTIYTNHEYLSEILQNFVTNAMKYTKKGSITFSASLKNKEHVCFSVTDSGIGISIADLEHVFERFWRSEDYRTRESSGTGLGLYLTKKLADSIGATITVDSTLDKGSTFNLQVPIMDTKEF